MALDDDLGERLKALAHENGRSFRDLVSEVVRRGLSSDEQLHQGRLWVGLALARGPEQYVVHVVAGHKW